MSEKGNCPYHSEPSREGDEDEMRMGKPLAPEEPVPAVVEGEVRPRVWPQRSVGIHGARLEEVS